MPAPTPKDPRDLEAIPAFLRARARAAQDGVKAAQGVRSGTRTEHRATTEALAGGETTTKAAGTADRGGRDRLDPASLPLPGLSRRRLATVAGIVIAAWLVLAFGRQVGEATAASTRADDLRSGNAALRQDVSTLQQDLARVGDARFIRLQGRQFGLGGPGEIPFTITADAPPLAADAPGSASVRLGAVHDRRSPLEVWLSTIFGG
jgi:hypothetical protein